MLKDFIKCGKGATSFKMKTEILYKVPIVILSLSSIEKFYWYAWNVKRLKAFEIRPGNSVS